MNISETQRLLKNCTNEENTQKCLQQTIFNVYKQTRFTQYFILLSCLECNSTLVLANLYITLLSLWISTGLSLTSHYVLL